MYKLISYGRSISVEVVGGASESTGLAPVGSIDILN